MKKRLSLFSKFSVIASLALIISQFYPLMVVRAAVLTSPSVLLSDSRPTTAATTYTITMSGITLSAIKCIKVTFSTTSTGTSKPTNMDITSAALSGTSTYIPTPGSWSISNNNTTGVSSITYNTGETPGGASGRTVVLTGITNGSVADTGYFMQFATFNNTDCASSPVDSGLAMFIYTTGQAVTATVDPTLTFTISAVTAPTAVNSQATTVTTTSSTIPFGTLSTGANSVAAQTLNVGTNAEHGYTVTIKYTGALSNGTHDITDKSVGNGSPAVFSGAGTEEFGYTTEDTSLGTGTPNRFSSNKWAKLETTAYEVAYNSGPASESIKVGYQVGISATTPPGSYSTTVIYIATPTY